MGWWWYVVERCGNGLRWDVWACRWHVVVWAVNVLMVAALAVVVFGVGGGGVVSGNSKRPSGVGCLWVG